MNASELTDIIESKLRKVFAECLEKPVPSEELMAEIVVKQINKILEQHGGTCILHSVIDRNTVKVTMQVPEYIARDLCLDEPS